MSAANDRIYTTFFDNVTIGTAVQDIISLKAGAANGIELHWIQLTAGGVSSPTEIRLRLKRIQGATVTQGSGGSTPTVVTVSSGDTKASAATVHANDTTQGSGTTTQTLYTGQWNQLLPFDFMPVPEDRPVCQGGEMFVFDLPAVIGASFSGSLTVYWAEVP